MYTNRKKNGTITRVTTSTRLSAIVILNKVINR